MTHANLTDDISEIRRRMEEAEETLRAIRSGEIDALVVEDTLGARVFTLQGADHPYRAIIESMQQGAVSLSANGTILFCNRCFAEMLRVPQEKVIGSDVINYLPAAEQETFEALLIGGREQVSQAELHFQAADGTLLPVYLALSPLPLDNAEALCLVVTDLTQQKRHQALQDATRRKDEFLAMLAHELRNPLAPIRNAVAIIEVLGIDSKELKFAREIIERQVLQMTHLIDDLLDVSRITLGKVKLQKERIELAIIVDRAIETSQPVMEARRQQFTLTPSPPGLCVDADPTRLTQVIGNLLTNAAKYTPEGGNIWLEIELDHGDAVIRVRDNGIGIQADLLPQVFDLFTQGDRSLARSEGGLGIGLTLVQRLVELHAGSVTAHSDGAGLGSEFVVRLPAVLPTTSQDAAEVQPIASASKKNNLRVLVVEDNKDGAKCLGMLLQKLGHEVEICYDGASALQSASLGEPPQVVLLDIGLPGMSGYQVAQRLRERPEFSTTTLIAMTGYGQDEDRQKSRQAGMDHHLVKPISTGLLVNLLNSLKS